MLVLLSMEQFCWYCPPFNMILYIMCVYVSVCIWVKEELIWLLYDNTAILS